MEIISYSYYFNYWKADILKRLKALRNDKYFFNLLERHFNYFFNKKINNISEKLSIQDLHEYQLLVTDKFYYMHRCQIVCPFNLHKALLIFSKQLLKFKELDKTEVLDFPSFKFLIKVNPYIAYYFLKNICKKY